MKKRLLLLASCWFLITGVWSQEVISSQGDSYTNSSGSLDFTIGEAVTFTGSDGTNDLTQGFHQSNWSFVGVDDQLPEIIISVFPNPMEETLVISTEEFDNVNYKMIDASGRIVRENKLTETNTKISVGELSPGNYQIVLFENERQTKTFKLIKNQ